MRIDHGFWPEEKTTWTAGAIFLAVDALTEHTPAAKLFLENQLMSGLLAGQVLEEAWIMKEIVRRHVAEEEIIRQYPSSQRA